MLYRAVVTVDGQRARVRSGWLRAHAFELGCTLGGALLAIAVASCGGGKARPAKAARVETGLTPKACRMDEVREYRCDALLPRNSALPAPEPYETCPSAIEVRDAVFPPRLGSGRFDARRTERSRRRAPPGTQCCYSWCGKLKVVEPTAVIDRCREPLAFHESYCIAEPERGTNGGVASAPFNACPAAIQPPEAKAFSVPNGALFDVGLTRTRRQSHEPLCCYGWCSLAPPGTALERGR
jgi:hypothetical protein